MIASRPLCTNKCVKIDVACGHWLYKTIMGSHKEKINCYYFSVNFFMLHEIVHTSFYKIICGSIIIVRLILLLGALAS